MPNEVSADNGFCSEANPEGLLNRKVRGYVAAVRSSKPADGKKGGKRVQARGFRQFLLRGIDKVKAEWAMICTAHNLAKRTRQGNIPTFARQMPAPQNGANTVAGIGS